MLTTIVENVLELMMVFANMAQELVSGKTLVIKQQHIEIIYTPRIHFLSFFSFSISPHSGEEKKEKKNGTRTILN
jgi:hypothetical protein